MPLQHIRVVDLSRLVPGPFCTMVPADLEADVIKATEPGEAARPAGTQDGLGPVASLDPEKLYGHGVQGLFPRDAEKLTGAMRLFQQKIRESLALPG